MEIRRNMGTSKQTFTQRQPNNDNDKINDDKNLKRKEINVHKKRI